MDKVIGICLTLTQAEISREFLNAMHKEARLAGYKLLCFNSVIDFKYIKSKGAEAIYDLIPYKMLDALVILHGTIHDERILNGIISKTKENDTPVIVAREERSDIYSVSGKYEDSFKEIIRHIVADHGAKDIFYISGRRNLESNLSAHSSKRYFMLKDTLKEYGIDLPPENVECGEYWEMPTIKIIDKIVNERKKLPDAIICANDVMAAAACERLMELGINVPKDVIVTGFDGLECSRFSEPSLTTCYEDMGKMAELIIQMVNEIKAGDIEQRSYYYGYETIKAGSCGCTHEKYLNNHEGVRMFRTFRMQTNDEENADNWLEALFTVNTYECFKATLSSYISKSTALLLRTDYAFLHNDSLGEKPEDLCDELYVLGNETDNYNNSVITREQFFDGLMRVMDVDGIYILSSVYVKELIIGLYIERVSNIHSEGYGYNRHVRTINKGLIGCLTQERHNRLKETVAENRYKDVETGLDNLMGLQRWFDAYTSRVENHSNYAEFCVFTFINHEDILDKFKAERCLECIKFIGKTLVEAHKEGTYVARISPTDFAVVIVGDDDKDRYDQIYSAVGVFYEAIRKENAKDPDGAQIEVSSGSIDMNPGWNDTVTAYISSAKAELYKNRVALYKNRPEDEGLDIKAETDAINLLNMIIKENRLTYHFQPIVDAHTGDIVAYEALMRVTGGIRLNPLELLDIAKRHRRLYSVERATMFNILDVFVNNQDKFKDRKVFINTIPGHFLHDEDLRIFNDKYSKYFDRCVIEITEDETITSEELDIIKKAGGDTEVLKVAVDDYGTGHSNVMNLMTYKPAIVKIDRFLMTDLHKDKNKQMVVKSVIDFSKENDIKVLAEGVETVEELTEAIKLGVDLIQGYYTARPQAEIIDELMADIKQSIIDANK